MNQDIFYLGIAIITWLLGYFRPEAMPETPFKHFNIYICLPKWLNGILRKHHSQDIPSGVISTSALMAQIGSILLILLYLLYFGNFISLENRYKVYYYIGCYLLGGGISIIVGKFRPYSE